MPGFDRTGPQGRGSMTGRQFGKCNDNVDSVNYRHRRGGRGNSRGAGFGNRIGYGRNQLHFLTDVSEKTLIENEINVLKDQLNSLEKRLQELQ